MGGNNAVNVNGNYVNGRSADIHINSHGSDWYFAVCALMGITTLAILAASFRQYQRDRIFFYITAGVNMVAMVAYFSMGSNLGWTPIGVEFHRSGSHVSGLTREIFYVRYIDWVITTPLILMDLLLSAGVPWPMIIWACLVDELMIVCGLVGALVSTRYKWGYFAFGCAAMLYIFYILLIQGRNYAFQLAARLDTNGEPSVQPDANAPARYKTMSTHGKRFYHTYNICCGLTVLLWFCYPIAWGVCEGGNVIDANAEAVFYGILDLIAKPVFSLALLAGHWNVPTSTFGLRMRDSHEPILDEKNYSVATSTPLRAHPTTTDNGTHYPEQFANTTGSVPQIDLRKVV